MLKRTSTFILLFQFFFLSMYSFSHAQVATTSRFVIPLNTPPEKIVQNLLEAKYITSSNEVKGLNIAPGAYRLSADMKIADVIKTLKAKPYMVWVVIPPGLRKEEIADILAKNLNWTKVQKNTFLKYTNLKFDYLEGIYFPDTYLIPANEDPYSTYKRFISKFNENFAKPLIVSNAQGFQWTRVLTLASLVQREAASVDDMPLIAGILLNRLDDKIPLGVDATLQYIRGDKNIKNLKATTTAYWAPITVSDKKIDSKYNTYKYAGLPPHPISNPGLDAINAVLYPATTTCIYYLHKNKITYCADTYAQHQENIEKYLK
jgi:UPF0755 protein